MSDDFWFFSIWLSISHYRWINVFVVITSFFFIFASCSRFISFLTNNVRRLFFFRYFLILKIIAFFCIFQLFLLIDVVVDRDSYRDCVYITLISRFFIDAYEVKRIMIFVVLRFILFNLIFIFLILNDICFFTISVDSKTFTRWKWNSYLNALITSIDLSRSEMFIFLIICFLQLFKKKIFKIVCIFMKTSRRFMNNDTASILTRIKMFSTINDL